MIDPDDNRPLLAGVCGSPISQTRSPALFRHWFTAYGIGGHYVPLLIDPADFENLVPRLPKAGFRGLNVTTPHKAAALAIADDTSSAAMAIGAANTLTFTSDGTIHADNTDGYGFLQNLLVGAPNWSPASGPAVILGAGGAARAALHILLDAGVPKILIANRTRGKADELAGRFGAHIEVVDWTDRSAALAGATLIANTTSLGMIGKPPLEIVLEDADPDAVVTDMVYNPLETELLARARLGGNHCVDGLGMLLHQARPGFQRWFGRDAQVTQELRNETLNAVAG
ncbi:MAG: shikimate dehydrogenase [Pseudomonadota bacterium]